MRQGADGRETALERCIATLIEREPRSGPSTAAVLHRNRAINRLPSPALAHEWSKNDERLLSAVEHGEADKVTSLLAKKGASAVKLDSEGKSALHLAAMRGQTECLAAILAQGGDVSVTDGSGLTALHLAAKHSHQECVRKLIQSKCLVDAVDASRKTALHHAAVAGNAGIVQLLCEHKCPVDVRDLEGCTALQLSATHNHVEACRSLLRWGADINACDKSGRTAFMAASESGSLAVLELLLQQGADLHTVDSMGQDVLHYAKLSGNRDVQTLVSAAFFPVKPDSDTQSPKALQPADVASPPYLTPSQTPPSSRSEASKRFNYKDEELRSVVLREEVEKLQEEKNMLLETIEDLKQIMEQTQPKGGVEDQGQIAALQAKIASLSLENQQLAQILKKRSSLQEERGQESSRPNSIDSNTSYHSTHANFDQTAIRQEDDVFEASTQNVSSTSRHKVEEEMEEEEKSRAEEEIQLLRKALECLETKLQESLQENQKLQARLSPCHVSKAEAESGPHDMTELQNRYQEAVKELKVLRERGLHEVQELKAQLTRVLEEREKDVHLIRELETRLEAEEEWRELKHSYKQLMEDSSREKALLLENQKESQEEIRMLQEALRGTVPVEAAAKDFEEMKGELSQVIEGLQRRLLELSHSYSEARSELSAVRGKLESQQVEEPQLQELVSKLEEARAAAAQAEAKYQEALEEVGLLRKEVEAQARGSVALADHTQVVSSLGNAIKELEAQVSDLQEQLSQKSSQVDTLQNQLLAMKEVPPESSVSQQEHEQLKESLEAEVGRLTLLLHDALRKQDEMALEAAAAWQEVKDGRSKRDQEHSELNSKYKEAQEEIAMLRKQTEGLLSTERDKNKKIDELMREVSKLKEALNSLSQLSYATGTPKRQNLQLDSLQQQVKQLQYQLAESKKQHHEIVSVYRMHLLYAVQGQMDEDVQKALKQILMMCKMPAEAK
ncbi:ankycorbin isoform X2 [Scleropages formosus]|uniref:ankycorbin isoform X2 n=1 Tax=Scleropages formosus TaxID=113540 RepID=UPI0010FA8B0E|nr:ankycorbin isoform X2 [Scleropages formosus]